MEQGRATPRAVDCARVLRVIETQALKGAGTVEDPCYIAVQYWSFDGALLAESKAPESPGF